MKKTAWILTAVMTLLCQTTIKAQTLNVQKGTVTYQIPAGQVGDMTFNDGTTLTILGYVYKIDDISKVYIDNSEVSDNLVTVNYQGTSADVCMPGSLANLLSVTVTDGHVSIIQSASVTEEITYVLSGSSDNGSFYMDGELKASIVLNGLTLNNPVGAAINIRDGKRISVELADGTVNTLTDGLNGSQKACFAVNGHTEFKGGGTLNLTGNTAHAFWGDEYVELKKTVGTINVLGAVGDGFNVNQYFFMKGGTVNINKVGDDGIQVTATDDETDEDNGKLMINGGSLTIGVTATAAKALKADSLVSIYAGDIILKGTGGMEVVNNDPSYCAGVKTLDFYQKGGQLSITMTGTAARGITADVITVDEGTLDITNSGAGQSATSDSYTAKGLKADTNIALNGGAITIAMSGTGGKGIKSSGTYSQGMADGTGPALTVSTTGSSLSGSGSGSGGGWGGWGGHPGGHGEQSNSGSSAKAIKVQGKAVLYGGETTVTTKTNGAEGLESKTSIEIEGGKHYFQCYDDCINSSGNIYFNGGVTICYSTGNDAIDSNAGKKGAVTIGDGVAFAYTSKGSPEEGFDCDNNSYISITGKGTAISAGGSQGGGGGWGGSSSGNTISNASQGYAFVTSSISYAANRYYTLADASGNNLVTYSFPTSLSSTLGLFTANGMKSGSTYTIKYSTTEPTDAETAFHGLYLGSSAKGTTNVTSFTAK